MKRCMLFVLIACALVLCACRPVEQLPTTGTGISSTTNGQTTAPTVTTRPTTVTPPTTTQPVPSTKPTEPTQPTDPVNDELAEFSALFGDVNSWFNRALTCVYTSPTQISLECLFYAGFSEESRKPTDDEWAQLAGKPGFHSYQDLMRLPVNRMNQVLTELFGITLEDMEDVAFEDVVYLESTNCYYHMVTDFFAVENFNAVAIENLEDGSIRVCYTANYESTVYAVTLMPHGDGYRILSNVPVE